MGSGLLLVLELGNRALDLVDVGVLLVHLLEQRALLLLDGLQLRVDVPDLLEQLSVLRLRLLVLVDLRIHRLLVRQLAPSHFATLLDLRFLVQQMLFLITDLVDARVKFRHFRIQVFLLRLFETRLFGWQRGDLGFCSENDFVVFLRFAVVEFVLPRVDVLLAVVGTLALLPIVAFAFFFLLYRLLALLVTFFARLCSFRSLLIGKFFLVGGLGIAVAVLAGSFGAVLLGLLVVRLFLFFVH